MAAATSHFRLEVKDDNAILRMVNGPNKFNLPFVQEFERVLDQVESNLRINSLIITAEGKFFSYGLDLPWIAEQTSRDVLANFFSSLNRLVERIATFPMLTVAALNGHAFGMGAILAMSCDYRVMRKGEGWFNFPETKLRLKFQYSSLELIRPKLTKFRTLRDAALYARRYTAEEAAEAEIVDEAVDKRDLLPTALRIAREVAGDGLDRETVRACKDKLFGDPLRAAKERDRESMSESDVANRFEAFKKGVTLVPSKM